MVGERGYCCWVVKALSIAVATFYINWNERSCHRESQEFSSLAFVEQIIPPPVVEEFSFEASMSDNLRSINTSDPGCKPSDNIGYCIFL